MSEHFERKDDMVIAHCRGGVEMDFDRAIRELNELENRRKQLLKKYNEMQDIIDEMRGVISGMESYAKLKSMGVLW